MIVIHECNKCPYFTTSVRTMEIHMLRHQSKRKLFNCERSILESFSCDNCRFKTSSVALFNQHLQQNCSIKNEKTRKKRPFTKLVYDTQKMKFYRRLYRNVRKCQECPYSTRSIFLLLNHVKRHQHQTEKFDCTKSVIEDYFCNQCRFSTKLQTVFRQHIIHCSLKNRPKIKKPALQKPESSVKWFKCKHCAYKTNNRSCLRSHNIHKHIPEGSLNWFKCTQCDYKAKMRNALNKHILYKHTPATSVKWFKCEHCDYKAKNSNGMKTHVIYKHTSEDSTKWFECALCDYKSNNPTSLKLHITNRHTPKDSISWFECEHCDYAAKRKGELNRHVLYKHTPDNSVNWVECKLCKYKTKRRYYLKLHVTRKHSCGMI